MARHSFKIIRAAAVLAVVLLCSLLIPCSAFAVEVTADIFNLDSTANIAVVIEYEGTAPDVTFIRPNGRELTAEDFTVSGGADSRTYYIPDASRGQWQIRYNKTGGKDIKISWAPYADALQLISLRYDRIDDAEYETDVYFRVVSTNDDYYNYRISAAVLDENGSVTGTKELGNGRARPGDEQQVTVRVSGMQAYHAYYMYVEVWREEYGVETGDSMLSDTSFRIDGYNMPEAISDFYTTVDRTTGTVYLYWNEFSVWCDEYIVSIYNADDMSKPLYNASLDDNVTSATASFPRDINELVVEIYYIDSGMASRALTKNIPVSGGTQFVMPAQGLTSSQQVTVSYSSEKDISAKVGVNDTERELNISGEGSFSLTLDEADNDIWISYNLGDETIWYQYSAAVTVDTTAPMLSLPENDVTLYTHDTSFILSGAAEAGASVTVNGVEVALNTDGSFTHTLTIAEGENEFVVNAIDGAGNASSQLFVITGLKAGTETVQAEEEKFSVLDLLPMILAVIACVMLLVSALLISKAHTKYLSVSKPYAITATIRNVFAALAFVSLAVTAYFIFTTVNNADKVNSAKLFEAARESLAMAYNMIVEYTEAKTIMTYGIIVTGSLIVLFLLAMVTALIIKKLATAPKKEKKPKPAKAPKPAKPVKAPKPAKPSTPEASVAPVAPAVAEQNTPTAPAIAQAAPVAPVTPAPAAATEVEEDEPTLMLSAPVAVFCSNCGTKCDPGTKFCDKCGERLD